MTREEMATWIDRSGICERAEDLLRQMQGVLTNPLPAALVPPTMKIIAPSHGSTCQAWEG